MTYYQDCNRHFGRMTRETDIARKLLEKHGKASVQAVKELRGETDMPMSECADMLRCMGRDMELERLQAENSNLRELVTYALKHIIEFECEKPDLKMFRGKPCEDCADCGSSDCPKCMPRMFDVSGIEVD